MPAYWLLKSEPDAYSYDDLERDGATVWDGVANNAALMYIRRAQPGDLALIYHTGDERRAVGVAEIISAAYPDPKLDNEKLAVMDVRPVRRLPQPVTLAAVKADSFFADFALVRQGRLSVVPVTEEQWGRLMGMAGA
ncbi:EVE domain-containing protein [Oscillochloris sp. ZM17-4]|uniref:EVE domain-containing protein n=1 Tax=Oscillochloris sp. ZM17-4 TaxID=2866714 RepID=UPI001C7367C4|nr:EVE domain-containing protein [Oscillochloris sp. ZM17-4]MBX0330661.1 EVE domain-containing protein [Oscillochloris sp. ZM17-4]